jgi:ABC-2 type transport system ATP-binding protein
MTVVDYLDYAATLQGVSSKDRGPCIVEALASTALTGKATDPISSLSRGYRQRTGVAQAILHKPQILILDEPTNGLDPTQIQQMRKLVRRLAEHSTVIISTHILQEVQAVCDRVIIVNNGAIALDAQLGALQADNRLLVHINAEPSMALTVFENCSGIDEAAESTLNGQEGYQYILTLKRPVERKELAASIASTVHDKGWQLFSMHFETRTLENVFAETSNQ